MKKIFVLFLLFLFIDHVSAGEIYVSKRDIDTGEYMHDCDFFILNSSGEIVDSWIQGDSYHVSNLESGSYELVSRPLIMGVFNDDMGVSYKLNVGDNILKFTIYNQKIDIPNNLGIDNYYFIFGFLFIFLGLFCCKYYFL